MTDIREAQVGDIYADSSGKLWRVLSTCDQPTVEVEEVEGRAYSPRDSAIALQAAQSPMSGSAYILKDRKHGGIGGAMWDGFKRIFRKDTSCP